MEAIKRLLMMAIIAIMPAGNAAEIFLSGQQVGQRCGLHINGEIVEGDAQRIQNLLSAHHEKYVATAFVFLNSPGGSVHEAIKIAKLMEEMGLNVTVQSPASCASACAIIYLSAPLRIRDGNVLVHRPYFDMRDVHPSDYVRYSEAQQAAILELRQYLSAKAVPNHLIDKMMTLPSSDAYALSLKDEGVIGMNPTVEEVAINKCGMAVSRFNNSNAFSRGFECVIDEVIFPMRGAFFSKNFGNEAMLAAIDLAKKMEAEGRDICPVRLDG